jgi:hypothetical protein
MLFSNPENIVYALSHGQRSIISKLPDEGHAIHYRWVSSWNAELLDVALAFRFGFRRKHGRDGFPVDNEFIAAEDGG